MADTDFDMVLSREASTQLQVFKDQSLLRRKFGEDAVRLYNAVGTGRTAHELMESLGLQEARFVEILEFMNNNGMVSVAPSETPKQPPVAPRITPQPEEEGEQQAMPPARKKEELSEHLLSPLEKLIFEKYGSVGVRIYNLIDGEKTAEEILKETGVSEARLVEILEFMDEQGIIKLEKPPEELQESASEEEEPSEEKAASEPRFSPMIEEEPEEKPFKPPAAPAKKPEEKPPEPEEPQEEIVMVDVPELTALSLMQRALLFAELSTKFGKGAKDLVGLIDGKRDFVDLSLATGLSFFDIDAIMAYFGKKGLMKFRQLARDEIKKKFGEDGFAIYKRFGRDGLLLYEMIGKEASLKDIILKSGLEVDRAIEILIFIHKVLGLDVPIDKNLIYRQLGMRK